MAASESTTVRMLFAMLRQMPVKNMDWNKVACDPALSEPISNGHAARMRYARLRQALETNTEVPGVDSSATKTTRQKGGVKKSKASAKPKQKKLPAQAQEQVLRSLEAQNIPPVKMEPFIKNEALDVDFSDCLATDPLMASPPFGIKGDTTTNSQHHFVHPFLSAPTSPDMAMMPEFTMGIGNADLQPRLLTPRSEQLFPSPQIGNQFDDFDLGQNGTSFEDAAFSTVIMAGLNGYNSQSLSLDGGVDPASVPLFVPDTDLTAGDIYSSASNAHTTQLASTALGFMPELSKTPCENGGVKMESWDPSYL